MANIFLTDRCNLHCPYCFANEFVNESFTEIDSEAYRKAVDFILDGGRRNSFGLIGGEPTTHSRFRDILCDIIDDARIKGVTVYTNGVLVGRYLNELAHPKFHLLVNCNHPDRMGQALYARMVESLDAAIRERHMDDRVTLGFNIDSPEFDYGFIIELLERYGFKRLRFSITVPNQEALRECSPLEYFATFKPALLVFYKDLLERGITPYYDCNKLPSCLIDDADLTQFEAYRTGRPERDLPASALESRAVHCRPVIDIMPDLTAVRCFGLSDCTKVRVEDFENIEQLEHYYLVNIDAVAARLSHSAACVDCGLGERGVCTGGCLAYKIHDVLELNRREKEYAHERFAG